MLPPLYKSRCDGGTALSVPPKGPARRAVIPPHQHHRGLSYLFDLAAPCACKDDGLSSVVIGSHRGHPVLLIHKERGPLDGDGPAQRLVKILAAEVVINLQRLSEEKRGEMSFLPMPRDAGPLRWPPAISHLCPTGSFGSPIPCPSCPSAPTSPAKERDELMLP